MRFLLYAIEGDGLDKAMLILLNYYLGLASGESRIFYFGGFSMKAGKGAR